jgi:hypothetical protein
MLATTGLLAFGIGGCRQPTLSLDGTATLGGRVLAGAELEVLGDSFTQQVRTDDRGDFHLPAVSPGLYSVTLFGRSTRLNPNDFQKQRQSVTKALRRLTARQKQAMAQAREATRLAGPGSDAETLWVDVSDCSHSDIKLEYK